MLTFLLILLGGVYLFGTGYLFVSRLDKWLEKKNSLPAVGGGVSQGAPCRVIVFGEKEKTTGLCRFFGQKQLIAISTEDLAFQREWKDVEYIIALSGSDLDNLSFCNIGKRLYQLKQTFSVCNDEENRGLYANNQIYVLDRKEIGQEQIFHLITGKSVS